MSSNRLIYDTCAYKQTLEQSVGPLAYQLYPGRFENCNKCRIELGTVGGTAVSHIKGNLVDLESDLKGTTRKASLCPEKLYQSPCPDGDMNQCRPGNIQIQGDACTSGRTINTNMQHLPSCQMIRYKPVPLPDPMRIQHCNN
jgi:hypothetical protein